MKGHLLLLLVLGSSPALTSATAVEEIAAHTHLGVATCSNSVCHGA